MAGDILKSTRKKSRHSIILIISCCLLAILVAGSGYYAAILFNPGVVESGPKETTGSRILPKHAAVDTRQEQMAVSEPPPVDLPVLTGIVHQESPESRIAIINDLPVMEGTLVEGYQVVSIDPDRVLLSKDNAEFTLRLGQQ